MPGLTQKQEKSARMAMDYLRTIPLCDLQKYRDAFSSCAIEGNRLGEVCAETLRRIMRGEPVSDRYLLGLCWAIRDMEEKKDDFFKSVPF